MVGGFGSLGYIFVSLKLCIKKEINFFCCFLVTLLNPTVLVSETQTPGIFSIIFTQVCHCLRQNDLLPKVWAVFEN